MKELIKGTAIFFILKVFGAIALLCLNILIAQLYGAQEFGKYSLVLAYLNILSIIALSGLDLFVIRKLPEHFNSSKKIAGFLQKSMLIILTSSIILGIAFNIYLLFKVDNWIHDYSYSIAGIILPFTLIKFLPEILRSMNSIIRYSVYKNILFNSIMLCVLMLAYYAFSYLTPIQILIIGVNTTALVLLIVIIKFLIDNKVKILKRSRYKERILKHTYPMLFTSSMLYLLSNVDSIMIEHFKDASKVGIYNACLKFSVGISFILASVNGYIAPKISQAYIAGDFNLIKSLYKKSQRIIILTSLPVTIIILLSPTTFLGLFGSEFYTGKSVLLILTITASINSCFGPVGYVLNLTDNQQIYMLIVFISLIINISLNLILIPNFSMEGAAYATIVSTLFWNLTSFLVLKTKKII